MSGDGWESIAAPSGQPWLRVDLVRGGWSIVVEIESPSGGRTRIATYGPLATRRQALARLMCLRLALAAAPGGNVAGVLATFGLPDLPGMISTTTATEAVRKAREGQEKTP